MSRRLMTRVALVCSTILCLLFLSLQPREPRTVVRYLPPDPHEGLQYQHYDNNAQRTPPIYHAPSPDASTGEVIVNLESRIPHTTYDGGLPGYNVFSNMYLSGGALVPVSADDEAAEDIPKGRSVLSGSQRPGSVPGDERWAPIVGDKLARAQLGKRAVRLPGVTYIFNDPPGKAGYLAFYEHFLAEVFVPAIRAVAHAGEKSGRPQSAIPSRLMFPRCDARVGWRDDLGKNVWFLQHVLPGVDIEEKDSWEDRAGSDMPYLLEKVVVVDRGSAHTAQGDTTTWGKMNMIVPTMNAPSTFFEPFRQNMIASVGNAMPHIGKYHLPIVVYIQREYLPRIAAKSHEAIVEGLKKLTSKAEVHVAQMRAMTRPQKIAMLANADIVISLTSEELYETAWMPPASTVIEIFEEGGFHRDYEVFVSILGHNHITVQNDKVLSEAEWRKHGRQRGPQKDAEVDVDADLIVRLVEEQLDVIAD